MRIWIKEKIIHKSYLQPHVDDIDLLVKYPPLDDRALNSRAREIDGMRLKKMTGQKSLLSCILFYYFQNVFVVKRFNTRLNDLLALKVWRVAPMLPRCFNSADSTL